MVIPRDSPHCANSSAAEISWPCVRGSPCGEAKLKRNTVSNICGLRSGFSRHLRLQERGKVGKQCAIDDLNAGSEGVDVVGEQGQIRW